MVTFLAHIRVRPGREVDFEGCIRSLYRATHEHEPGVRRYEYWRGAEERTYYTLASFEDFHAFIDHQTSEHHEAAGPKLKEVIEAIRLEWVDPVEGSSPLPWTDSQPSRPDASPLASSYHERFAADIQSWWLTLRRDQGIAVGPGGGKVGG
jgi:quinol monooxygenase YgiN